MSVFISYRHTDRSQALAVQERLRHQGIDTRLDVMDEPARSTGDIARLITGRIREATHLLAVVSQPIGQAWWVPFGIGEAAITDTRITTLQVGLAKLPEYLDQWPLLRTYSDLSAFIYEYHKDRQAALLDSIGLQRCVFREGVGHSCGALRTAEDFHRALRQRLKGV
ncbi:toll/interleukin-1 receptor domain-containing protein [Pseudomonas typographi]|uniref:TIR domain-containing protein n=1 Tax=Pseudomonas typographi TaxID=2715964 RepID=A0ABR7Z5Q1_9PSED|nr:toll/interleukin-1 receptor domain-containing protein [Pseudomonas typographi]MBD1551808.1 TIR domain-containing protein [Pseudomonas typographi]MBD1587609.1 TIR domain-containing protein [Pseudomonas typographi]MBD1600795.1 TIR domain-containing protein [Pseudomonas typographi]